ncbi:hypothetical protein GQ457_04G002710 [Hibiscus cannabinus]
MNDLSNVSGWHSRPDSRSHWYFLSSDSNQSFFFSVDLFACFDLEFIWVFFLEAVTVVGCKKLKDTEWLSRQDPYVCLEYGSSKCRTQTCTDGGKTPKFQEKFTFSLIEGLVELQVVVWNSNTLSHDDLIGYGRIQLHKVISQGYDDNVWPLQTKTGRPSGDIRLIMHYPNARMASQYSQPSAPPAYVAAPPPPQPAPYNIPPPTAQAPYISPPAGFPAPPYPGPYPPPMYHPAPDPYGAYPPPPGPGPYPPGSFYYPPPPAGSYPPGPGPYPPY